MSFLRHLASILLLPGTVLVLVPYWICQRFGMTVRPTGLFGWIAVAAGLLLASVGLILLAATIRLFATRGRGTLAPWDPPKHLVVRGPYRFVRNPMISGVILIACGEALALRSVPLAAWAAAFVVLNAIYIPLFEERQLESRFGEEYRRYRQNVPGLIPRLRPWGG